MSPTLKHWIVLLALALFAAGACMFGSVAVETKRLDIAAVFFIVGAYSFGAMLLHGSADYEP